MTVKCFHIFICFPLGTNRDFPRGPRTFWQTKELFVNIWTFELQEPGTMATSWPQKLRTFWGTQLSYMHVHQSDQSLNLEMVCPPKSPCSGVSTFQKYRDFEGGLQGWPSLIGQINIVHLVEPMTCLIHKTRKYWSITLRLVQNEGRTFLLIW